MKCEALVWRKTSNPPTACGRRARFTLITYDEPKYVCGMHANVEARMREEAVLLEGTWTRV